MSKYYTIKITTTDTLDKIAEKRTNMKSGETNTKIYNYAWLIKLTECIPISGGNISELNKVPDLFLNKRSLLILKNNNDKYFLYCYIRKFLDPITKNSFRITKKDKEIANRIINETNLTFENVSINEMNKIEKNQKLISMYFHVIKIIKIKIIKIKILLENLKKIMIKY